MKLIVTQPFGHYETGQEITDPATITEILDSSNASFVVQVVALGDSPE